MQHDCKEELRSAGRATAVDHKAAGGWAEFFRQHDIGDFQLLKTVGLVASGAVEVDVNIIGVAAGAIFSTERIFGAAGLIMNLVNQAVLFKRFQGPVESGPVGSGKLLLQLREAHCYLGSPQEIHNQQTHGRRLNMPGLQFLL